MIFNVYYECHRIESDLKNYALQSIRYKKFIKKDSSALIEVF